MCNNFIDSNDSIFNVLTFGQKTKLKKHILLVEHKKDELIFKEGYKPSGLISLAKGKVKIFKEGVAGKEQILRLAKINSFIGFRALFADEYYNATAIAIEDSTVCFIDKKVLMDLINKNIKLAEKIIKYLAVELGNVESRTISLSQKYIRGRLSDTLLALIDTYGYEDDEKTLKVELIREDIANYSNMTKSNVSRTLNNFAEENIIEINQKSIKIIDFEAIVKLSEIG